MTPWQRKAQRRTLIRKSEVRKMAGPYADAAEGSRAYREDKSPVECPYQYGGKQHHSWTTGWLLAYEKGQR